MLTTFISAIFYLNVLMVKNKLFTLKRFSKKEILKSAFLGFLNPYLYYMLLFRAYTLLPAQEALTLNYTWAIMVVLLSVVILKQKIKLGSILSILISFCGVIVIATQGNIADFHLTNFEGAGSALGSAVIWALYWLLNLKDNRDEYAKLFLNFAFGFAFILITNIATSNFTMPSLESLPPAIYIGLFEMGLTFVLWLLALRKSETTALVSNLIYLSPFMSLVFINFIVGERIVTSTIIGLLFIVAGIFLQQFFARTHHKQNKKIKSDAMDIVQIMF